MYRVEGANISDINALLYIHEAGQEICNFQGNIIGEHNVLRRISVVGQRTRIGGYSHCR